MVKRQEEPRPLPTDEEILARPDWSTVVGRLLWAKARLGVTWSKVSELAGFKDRMHAAETIRRMYYEPEFAERVQYRILKQLADGLRVSLMWTLTGRAGPNFPDGLLQYPEELLRVLERKENAARWSGRMIDDAVQAAREEKLHLTERGWFEFLDEYQSTIEKLRHRN